MDVKIERGCSHPTPIVYTYRERLKTSTKMDVDFEDIVDVVADENAKPNAKAKGGSKKKTIEQTYTKKTQLEHILLRPDTYGTC
jgi:hypothetical protein